MSALDDIVGKKISGSGVICKYYRINESKGVKVYPNGDGHREFRKSRIAYKLGFGPKAWGYCRSKTGDKSAFYVEHVEVMQNIIEASARVSDLAYCLREWSIDIVRQFRRDIDELSKANGMKMDISDLHNSNIGVLNNKPMIIDFSHCHIDKFGPHWD